MAGAARPAPDPGLGTPVTSSSPVHWTPAYVGLGSNLDGPTEQLRLAVDGLARMDHVRLVSTSAQYQTVPVGPVSQPDFTNAVAALLTTLDARALLDALLGLERRLGRLRDGTRWGPRRIDLDLLVFGAQRIDEPGLCVPHLQLAKRDFVLRPLHDVAPELDVPGVGRVAALLAAIGGT